VCAHLQHHPWSCKCRSSKGRSCENMTSNLIHPLHPVHCMSAQPLPYLRAMFQQEDAAIWQQPSLPRQKLAHKAHRSSDLHPLRTTRPKGSASLCLWSQQLWVPPAWRKMLWGSHLQTSALTDPLAKVENWAWLLMENFKDPGFANLWN
jgi:hypothetical protein